MKLLALDTATETMAIAVSHGGAQWTLNSPGGAAASLHLIPEALRLLAEAGLSVAALDAVAFGQGPGAFTGLRTAVSVAQGLAFGADKPLLPIDSLLLVAEDARLQAEQAGSALADSVFWVAMDARMDEIYAAAYRQAAGTWQVVQAPALYTLEALLARWQDLPPAHVAGSALAAFGDRLGLAPALPCWPDAQDRAGALLRLASAAWQHGATVTVDEALPVYLRDKVALTTAEREAAKAAKALDAAP
ncbi:tRNA (adenosine(37)-N6)-threonylcarbamoyltransferase complex dimerization subunit type 1 TsaB [Ideonella sp.]|uniref:tRNA (adenosine(37)-N6)-threonylcarbamoyltransferase complex dimerization subunit type 1 TsaB n=1 Tax=Ideonella sp. TaxID=1929293 RepID=UPI003BB59B8A